MHALLPWILSVLAARGEHVGPVELGHRNELNVEAPSVKVHAASASLHVAVELTLSTERTEARDRFIVLRVPRDLQVVALAVSNGDQHLAAELTDAAAAREAYRDIVRPVASRRDPALLEWLAATADNDHYRLRVFPVVKGRPMRVYIELDTGRAGVDGRKSLIAVEGPQFVSSGARPISIEDVSGGPCL